MPLLSPMLVTPAVELPVGDWAYELKWDGMRALVAVDHARVTITSRPGRPHADTFPELAALADGLDGRQALLDGEIVCMGADGRPSFDRLGTRLVNAKRARFWVARFPATFVAFDLLRLDGTDLMDRPWEERRAALVALGLDLTSGPWRVNPAYDNGADLLAVTGDRPSKASSPNIDGPATVPAYAHAGGSNANTYDGAGWMSSAGNRRHGHGRAG